MKSLFESKVKTISITFFCEFNMTITCHMINVEELQTLKLEIKNWCEKFSG